MYVAKAHKIYLVLAKGKAFKSVPCWQVCRKCPKWSKLEGVTPPVAESRDERKRAAVRTDGNLDAASIATTSSSSGTAARPKGNKKAKAQVLRNYRKSKRLTYQRSAAAMAMTQDNKNSLMELQIGISLFKDDTSDVAKEFRNRAKAMLIANMRAKDVAMAPPANAIAIIPNKVDTTANNNNNNNKPNDNLSDISFRLTHRHYLYLFNRLIYHDDSKNAPQDPSEAVCA